MASNFPGTGRGHHRFAQATRFAGAGRGPVSFSSYTLTTSQPLAVRGMHARVQRQRSTQRGLFTAAERRAPGSAD